MLLAAERLFKNIALVFINKSYRKYIRLALSIGDKKRHQKTVISLRKLPFLIPDNRSFLAQFLEIFVDESYFFETINKSPLILDCGANIGTSIFYFNKIYPQAHIVAYEPDPDIFRILSKNVGQLKTDNINIIQAAVWKNDEKLSFESKEADAGTISPENKDHDTIIVEGLDLKSIILRQKRRVELLKIDIEGAEYEVLLNSAEILHLIDNIFVECHSFHSHSQRIHEVLELFATNGFRYYIKNESNRKKPFINTIGDHEMDMQLNIYAYK